MSLRDYAALPGSLTDIEAGEALQRLITQLDVERQRGRTIVFTNGVFDILHAGHVHLLRQAKQLGDVLVVGVNSDQSAQRLKGKHRPINSERDRLALVAALDPVDYVALFDEDTPATLIRTLRPHIHVKGGDYADEQLPEAGKLIDQCIRKLDKLSRSKKKSPEIYHLGIHAFPITKIKSLKGN